MDVSLFVFSLGDPARGPLASGPFGLPVGGLHGVELRAHRRDEDPAWFDRFRSGPLRASALAHLGDLDDLDACDVVHHVHVAGPDPTHLGHLQAAWAAARWLLAGGGRVVLDAAAIRFRRNLPPPAAGPVLRDHVSMLVEAEPVLGGDGHVLHTRGLRSFGRPDLVTVVRATDADAVGQVILGLASALADGWMPDGAVDVTVDGETLTVHPDPGLPFVPRLGLNNDALVVTDARGEALVGFAQRHRRLDDA